MSLVVGYAVGDIGFLVADTLLTTANRPSVLSDDNLAEFHRLKVHILSDDLAIGYAGDVAIATDLIADFSQFLKRGCAGDPAGYLCQRLTSWPQEECDFLVLSRDSEWHLQRVSSKGIVFVQRAYIGDTSEYKKMRKLQLPYAPPAFAQQFDADGSSRVVPTEDSEGTIEFVSVGAAFEALTQSSPRGSVGSVGGYVTRVINAKLSGNLEYLQTKVTGNSPWESNVNASLLASNSGTRGIGLYFSAWNKGLLFVAGSQTACSVQPAKSEKDFVEAAYARYRLQLE